MMISKNITLREVNNVIAHVFHGRITYHYDETFNSLDNRTNKNILLKPSMISHSPYHPNRVSNSCQPDKIN